MFLPRDSKYASLTEALVAIVAEDDVSSISTERAVDLVGAHLMELSSGPEGVAMLQVDTNLVIFYF